MHSQAVQRKRPARPQFHPENIPTSLRSVPQWILWRYEWKAADEKWDKPPRRLDGKAGSSTDPLSRYEFAAALRAYQRQESNFDGIGFVLTGGDPYTAIDLDHCVDPSTASVQPWAREIVNELDSYVEISPSGTGLRIMVRASLPATGRKRGNIEMYDNARYVTITGDVVEQKPIAERQAQINTLHAATFPVAAVPEPFLVRSSATIDDQEILDRARRAKNGLEFDALWRGENVADRSAADVKLCGALAFWTGRDPLQMARLFRLSGLMRPKWDSRRNDTTYGAVTIAKAIQGCREVHSSSPAREQRYNLSVTKLEQSLRINFKRADQIEPIAIPWFDRDRFPAGEFSILEGDGGTGKSSVALDYVARKSRGATLPGGTPTRAGICLVVADEDAKSTIVARLQAAGADRSKVLILTSLGPPENMQGLVFPDHAPELARFIKAESVDFVYLDALFNHFATGLLPKNPQDARRALSPLSAVAHETGATILATRHWGKGARDATERGLGANEIKNVARSVLVIARHPEIDGTFAMAVAKKNYGRDVPALTYRIASQQVFDGHGNPMRDPHGELFTVGRIEWGESAAISADDLAMGGSQNIEAAAGREACSHFLSDILSAGELPSAKVYESAESLGFSRSTTLRAAKRIGIIMRNVGFPKTSVWTLPTSVASQPLQSGGTKATTIMSVDSLSPQGVEADVTEATDATERVNTQKSTVTSVNSPPRVRAREDVTAKDPLAARVAARESRVAI